VVGHKVGLTLSVECRGSDGLRDFVHRDLDHAADADRSERCERTKPKNKTKEEGIQEEEEEEEEDDPLIPLQVLLELCAGLKLSKQDTSL
jgi:hypothetical protein